MLHVFPAQKSIVGIISDTHGLLRPEVIEAFHGVDLILHAGDVVGPLILRELSGIAKVIAVRGNNDRTGAVSRLPETQTIKIGTLTIFLIHEIKKMRIDPQTDGYGVVVYGHSHKPGIEQNNGVLFLNPGSAGPRRFNLPVTVARLTISGKKLHPEILCLLPG